MLIYKSVCVPSRVRFFAAPWNVARQASLSMEFSRQEYGSRLPFPPPGNLPDPGTEPTSPESPALAGGFFTTGPPWKPTHKCIYYKIIFLIYGSHTW